MTIATRLLALLTVPVAVLVGLGVFTGLQLANIEARTRFVAESRIVALATLGNLSRAFAELRVNVRSHLLATTDAQRAAARARFDHDERDVNRLLQEYADRLVLGGRDRRLLSEFEVLSREYNAGARQVMRLADEGRTADAIAYFDNTIGKVGVRLSEVSNEWIAHDQQAATAAGTASIAAVERFRRNVVLATLAALLLTAVLGFVTLRRIVNPIRALDASVNAIAAGDYAKAVPFVGATDETGGLARSIDVLKQGAALMDEQRWVKSNVSKVTAELQGAASRPEFGERLLSNLVPILGGGVASFYVFDETGGHLQRVAAYGLANVAASPESIRLGEGLVGQCARERQTVTLTSLPPQYLRVESSVGQAAPFQASALPVTSHEAMLGVLEVASFRSFTAREQALLNELLPVVAMNLDVLQRNLRTQELLDQTQEQARRLEASEGDLRKGSEQLQRTNFLADTALELTQAGYWHVPLDGSGWYNSSERAARIFGDIPNPDFRYRVAEWADHVREGDEEAWKATMENFTAAVDGRIPAYSAVYAYKRPVDGRVVWIRALGNVVKDGSGKPVDMFGVTQDITEFKRLEGELVDARRKAEEATEMKSMFLANMSHEIRTPMNAIIGLSHLALKTEMSPKQRDYVGKIHNAGTSLLAVINDILDFSKIEAGRLDLESIDFELDDVIGSVTTLTGQKAHDKGLEFLVHVAPGIPDQLIGDPIRLGQILTNCVNNAVKFTERGEIRINIELLERTGEKVELKFSVRDTGIGMTSEQSARLFQPFVQADMSTTRKHGGTGLGLTISRRLVELMGGRIWLDSEAGVGTTFHFTVWLGAGDAKAARRIVPARLARLRVLIVDDNAAAREILQEPLSAVVSHVDVAGSGKEAISAVQRQDRTEPYDIVFMDWRMPGMDGLQASRHIKSDETLSHHPAIVLVTAFGREEVREEAERLQLDGFLLKPVTKSMVVDTLVNVFAHGESERVAVAEPQDTRLAGARILLVEDNEINQQIAVELLEGAGATVTIATNGREAVEILTTGPQPPPFDAVLMDLQMPEMDGYQATAKLRADPRMASLPIVAMTAHATIEERQRCLAAGMNDHVAKPIDPASLLDTVGRFYEPAMRTRESRQPVHDALSEDVPPNDAPRLPVVAGLDTQSGLARVAGNVGLYLKLLRQFVEQQAEAVEQIDKALGSGDSALAERLAHTLKGVAGNIGAASIQSVAGVLEKLIRNHAPAAELTAAKQQVAAHLEPVVRALRDALESTAVPASAPEPAVPSANPVESRKAAAGLLALLSELDPAASDFVATNRAALRPLFSDEAWPQFERLLTDYSFAEAQTRLENALQHWDPVVR